MKFVLLSFLALAVAATESPKTKYCVTQPCNERVQEQIMKIDTAVAAYHEFEGTKMCKDAFASINIYCRAMDWGLYCPIGGEDKYMAEFDKCYARLQESNTASGDELET